MTAIEVRNVSKRGRRSEPPLLDGISLRVGEGRSLAIVGPAGAGKSLLLRTIVGLESVDHGDILLDGVAATMANPRDRDIAMAFQDVRIHPHLSVFANLAFAARLRKGLDKQALADRVYEVAELLGLATVVHADTPVRELSESQCQLVALGRALVRDAAVYLFDDVLAAQDERWRGDLEANTAHWQRALGRTSIYVSSSVGAALSLADEVAVLHQGRLQQVGTPRELYTQPANLFVAAFVGLPAMNLIPATVLGKAVELPFITLPLSAQMRGRVGGRDLLVVGIRPEDCEDASGWTPEQQAGKIVFSTRVDDVEWRGRSQYAYLGYEIDERTQSVLGEVEQRLDFELFGTFLLAELAGHRELSAGMFLKVAVESSKVHLFDPVSGENLTLGDPQ